jgi:hypothetical protein
MLWLACVLAVAAAALLGDRLRSAVVRGAVVLSRAPWWGRPVRPAAVLAQEAKAGLGAALASVTMDRPPALVRVPSADHIHAGRLAGSGGSGIPSGLAFADPGRGARAGPVAIGPRASSERLSVSHVAAALAGGGGGGGGGTDSGGSGGSTRHRKAGRTSFLTAPETNPTGTQAGR